MKIINFSDYHQDNDMSATCGHCGSDKFYVYLNKITSDPYNSPISGIACVNCSSKEDDNVLALCEVVNGMIGIDKDEV